MSRDRAEVALATARFPYSVVYRQLRVSGKASKCVRDSHRSRNMRCWGLSSLTCDCMNAHPLASILGRKSSGHPSSSPTTFPQSHTYRPNFRPIGVGWPLPAPTSAPGMPQSRLYGYLKQTERYPLTLVSAPVGYGKSTILSAFQPLYARR